MAFAILLTSVALASGCGGSDHAKPAPTIAAAADRYSAIASGTIPCDLKLKYGQRSENPRGQFHLNLVIVNADDITKTTCRVSGYPDVELIGPVNSLFGTIYTLPPQASRTGSVTLRLAQSAHAVLTWLPPSPGFGERWVPGYVRVTVHTNAGPSLALALPWRYGPVLRQDGATHPGSYIGPVRQGAG